MERHEPKRFIDTHLSSWSVIPPIRVNHYAPIRVRSQQVGAVHTHTHRVIVTLDYSHPCTPTLTRRCIALVLPTLEDVALKVEFEFHVRVHSVSL